jgi:hypothetical protein
MKKIISCLALTVLLFACKKDTGNITDGNQNSPLSVLTGTNTPYQRTDMSKPPKSLLWMVGSLIINGMDETGYFTTYSLEFRSDNIVVATDGRNFIYGKWYSANDLHLSILFDTDSLPDDIFTKLNGDFTIIKLSDQSIYLECYDINTGNVYKELRLDRI